MDFEKKTSSESLQKMNSFYDPKVTLIKTFDISTLYTSVPYQKVKERMHRLVNQIFLHKNGSRRYNYLVVNGDRTFLTNEEISVGKTYYEIRICQMLYFLMDNIYIKIGNHLFIQCITIGIPMGTNCAPVWLICFCTRMR